METENRCPRITTIQTDICTNDGFDFLIFLDLKR